MKKIMVILAIIIIPLVYMKYNDQEQIIIPKDAIRIRVIANSNSYKDQFEKQQVRENIQFLLKDLLKDAKTKNDTKKIINNNIEKIRKNIDSTLNNINSVSKYKINYGNNYFPQKEFKGVTYDAGYYESLVITIGSGRGNNWWCVLFPPLCLMPTEEENMSNVEYGLFLEDVISNYK